MMEWMIKYHSFFLIVLFYYGIILLRLEVYKMKFKAEPKDVLIFAIFCIFLLLVCSIVVVNASYIANYGYFYGLNPFKGFAGEYITATFMFFLLALIGIFTAVSSYFFERESGFGFSFGGKKNDGYSRWAKKSEVTKQLVKIDPKAYRSNAAGIAVINDGKELWVDNGEAHSIVVGSTGSGKTQIVVFPMVYSLAKHGESMIITDPKGEIYETTGEMLRERGYNIVLLNFRSPANGNSWNPMALPYKLYKEGNTDKAIELLDDLALNILYEEKNGNADPFWEKSAADYFTGLALGLFEDAPEKQVNLNSMNLMSSLGEERFGGPNNNYIKEYFNSKDPSRPAYVNASGTVFSAEDTKQGVLSTFKQKVKLFASRDNLSEMLSYSDFDMKEIGRQKTAVFMIVQDEKKTLHPLATIFIKQIYETLIDVAQESGGKLPYRTNFILDEFANMPPLKDVTTMVTAARSRLIRFTFIIQNYAQLTQVYGKENAETIKGNCNIMYLISNELQALEELSKLCGEKKSKEKDKTASTPLVTVSDLQRLQQFETISLRLRTMPFKTKLVPNFKMNWGKKYEKATYPTRAKHEVQLFDIREYVKDMKKKKMEEMMSASDGGEVTMNPFQTGMNNPLFSASPFAVNNPFANPRINKSSGGDGSFNVDDLVKRIDAKIAKLEEEERKEKEEEERQQRMARGTKTPTLAPASQVKETPSVVPNVQIVEPQAETLFTDNSDNVVVNAPASDKINISELDKSDNELYVDETDDDNFFDDFFYDE